MKQNEVTPPGDRGPASELLELGLRSMLRPEPKHLMARWWELARGHAPIDADEADLLVYAYEINPDAWTIRNVTPQIVVDRYGSLAASMRVRRKHRERELPPFVIQVQRAAAAVPARSPKLIGRLAALLFPEKKEMAR